MFNKDCYIVIPVMETVHDDIIQYKRIVYRYFCIKCRKSFLNKKEYILIGYNENYEKIINELEKNYDIKVFHYENSQKIIFETIFY